MSAPPPRLKTCRTRRAGATWHGCRRASEAWVARFPGRPRAGRLQLRLRGLFSEKKRREGRIEANDRPEPALQLRRIPSRMTPEGPAKAAAMPRTQARDRACVRSALRTAGSHCAPLACVVAHLGVDASGLG